MFGLCVARKLNQQVYILRKIAPLKIVYCAGFRGGNKGSSQVNSGGGSRESKSPQRTFGQLLGRGSGRKSVSTTSLPTSLSSSKLADVQNWVHSTAAATAVTRPSHPAPPSPSGSSGRFVRFTAGTTLPVENECE